MSNSTDLKKLWKMQAPVVPDTRELYELAKKFRNRRIKGIVITNVLLLLTCGFIAFIWYTYQPEMITTKAGIVLIILAMLIFLFAYNRMLPMLIKAEYDTNSSEYVKHLLKIREKQRFMQTTMMNIYFVLLSAGICMYMIEYVARMPLLWGIFAYAITLLWIGFNWFFLRPKTIKKQQNSINKLIRDFERLNEQLGKED